MNSGEHFEAVMNFLVYQETGECEPCEAMPCGGNSDYPALDYAEAGTFNESGYEVLEFIESPSGLMVDFGVQQTKIYTARKVIYD